MASRFTKTHPAVSPDGRWLAYISDQTGAQELYLRPFDRDGDVLRVSPAGAGEPRWGASSRELVYRAPTPTGHQDLFDVSDVVTSTPHTDFDVSPGGRSFAVVRANPSSHIVVSQHVQVLVAEKQASRRR